jgi:hypothetical protein
MDENRRSQREPAPGVSALIYRPEGPVLEGVVQNVSEGGIKVSTNPAGLNVGDAIDIAVVIQGEKVRYACEVKHVQPSAHSVGVQFQSAPKKEAESRVKRCMQCRRDFAFDCRYCSNCGQKLVTQ